MFPEFLVDGTFPLSNAKFEDMVNFSKAKFKEIANFSESTFEGEALFISTQFPKGVNFHMSQFNKKTNFTSVTIRGFANFEETHFEENAEFKFYTEIEKANFTRANFGRRADFQDSNFIGLTNFTGSIFSYVVDFSNSVFDGKVSFGGAHFQNNAIFSGCNFEKEALFRYSTFEQVCILNAEFVGELDLNLVDFRQGVDIIKNPDDFPEEKFKLNQAKEEACRVQKISYEKEGKKEEADCLFREEMRAKRDRKRNSSSWWRKFVAYAEEPLVDWTCEYGTNPLRVIGLSLLLIFGFPFIYWVASAQTGAEIVFSNGGSVSALSLSGLADSIHYSIVTFTTLGSGGMYPQGFLKFVSNFESLAGALLIALLIAVFARKWMR